MGNVLTDGNGHVIVAGNNAFEVTPSIDSNIQAGNIKKDVTILGVTGTYEGSGGGGFKCTNKQLGSNYMITDDYTFQYTFNGELDSAAIALLDNNNYCIAAVQENINNWHIINVTTTWDSIMFQDLYWRSQGYKNLISNSFNFVNNDDMNSTVSINNSGLLRVIHNTTLSEWSYVRFIVIFKGIDETYDFDYIDVVLYDSD